MLWDLLNDYKETGSVAKQESSRLRGASEEDVVRIRQSNARNPKSSIARQNL